jgi:hypothetical protein
MTDSMTAMMRGMEWKALGDEEQVAQAMEDDDDASGNMVRPGHDVLWEDFRRRRVRGA